MYYEIDEFKDVVFSLKQSMNAISCETLQDIDVKWAIIAAHSSLQGACVCYLTRSDGGGALQSGPKGSPNNHEEMWLYYQNYGTQKALCENSGVQLILPEPDRPEVKLANLRELANRLPEDLRFPVAKNGTWPDDIAAKDFTRIYRWRNAFMHFPPQTWSIELAGIPRILSRAVSKVEQIANAPGFQTHPRFEEHGFAELVRQIRSQLGAFPQDHSAEKQ